MLRLVAILIGIAAVLSPTPGKRVYDFASIIPATIASEIQTTLAEVERETTAQVVVVTVTSLDGLDIDQYALESFKSWGIGRKDYNNGVLFVIAPNERRSRIEVGYGLEKLITDSLAGEILDTEVIPYFKNGDYGTGIKNGTAEIARILRAYPEAARGVVGSQPTYVLTPFRIAKTLGWFGLGIGIFALVLGWFLARKKNYSPVLFLVIVAALVGVGVCLGFSTSKFAKESIPAGTTAASFGAGLLALFSNIRSFRRYRPHHCKSCGTQLRLLNEKEDDVKLTKEELLEETLGSIDYDVWICPACLKQHTLEYKAFLSNFSNCSKCKRKTYSESSKVLLSATHYSTGSRQIDGECKNCWYKTSRTEIIPRITSSSSSSSSGYSGSSGGGSSFGGGSSGGGGASRGW